MNKKELIKAIDKIYNDYDAYYFSNKYGDLQNNTHSKEFQELFKRFQYDEKGQSAINWILNCYDCYYKEDFKEGSAFNYLKNKILKEEQ